MSMVYGWSRQAITRVALDEPRALTIEGSSSLPARIGSAKSSLPTSVASPEKSQRDANF
jgi:hypothetical protein